MTQEEIKMNEEGIVALYEALENAIENVKHYYSVQDSRLEDMWLEIANRLGDELRNAGEE